MSNIFQMSCFSKKTMFAKINTSSVKVRNSALEIAALGALLTVVLGASDAIAGSANFDAIIVLQNEGDQDIRNFNLAHYHPATAFVAGPADMLTPESAASEVAEMGVASQAPVAQPSTEAKVEGGVPPVSDNQGDVDFRRQRRTLGRMELVFQLLNLGDAITTISCVERKTCKESNPLYGGGRPSWARIAGTKAGVGLVHYLVYRTLAKMEPRLAKIFEFTTISVQGAAVIWNMTIVLK